MKQHVQFYKTFFESMKHKNTFYVSNIFYSEKGDSELTSAQADKEASKFKIKMENFLDKKGLKYKVEENDDFDGSGYGFEVETELNNIEDIVKIFPKGKFEGVLVSYKQDEADLD